MSHFTLKVSVPACRVCDCLMTLQDTRHNEPDGGTDSLVYLCENCPGRIDNTAPSVEDQRFDLQPEKIKAAAERRFKGMGNVDISSPYWIDVDYGTVRVGIGYGEPDANGVRPGSFGANYNYIKGEFE